MVDSSLVTLKPIALRLTRSARDVRAGSPKVNTLRCSRKSRVIGRPVAHSIPMLSTSPDTASVPR